MSNHTLTFIHNKAYFFEYSYSLSLHMLHTHNSDTQPFSRSQDVVALDRILSESGDVIDDALPRYSELMVLEGQALAELTDNFFPRSPLLAAASIARQLAITQWSNWFPDRVYPPIQSLTSETLMPYSEVRGNALSRLYEKRSTPES